MTVQMIRKFEDSRRSTNLDPFDSCQHSWREEEGLHEIAVHVEL